MTTNEKLFKILDKMFEGKYNYLEYLDAIIEKNSTLADITVRPCCNLENAFYLAEKVGLFEYKEYKGYMGKWVLGLFNGDYEVTFLGYEPTLEELVTITDNMFFWLGKTPQEAIVNAIIEIYGEKE